MRKASLVTLLLLVLVSLSLLSVLSSILAGYPESSRSRGNREKQPGWSTPKEPPAPLFRVSPARPQLFWRISTADYYTGLNWLRTTDEEVLEEFPQAQHTNATTLFTVEINVSNQEILLPLAPTISAIANISFEPSDGLEFYADIIGDVYKVTRLGQEKEVQLVYNVPWYDSELDDWIISLANIPEEISDKYLQLPDLPSEVWEFAKDLENPSYSILDQVLADVQFLRTNFVYDVEASQHLTANLVYEVDPLQYLYERITQGSDISSYIDRKKGICVDAATALAIILRIQKIPARIGIGYKPARIEHFSGKLLYDTTGAHSVTEVYLPPFGWIQFDATPPLEENPLVEISPFKKESSPGSRLFCQLSITNRYKYADHFKVVTDSRQEWNIETVPEELWINPLQIGYALLEVTVPDDADIGDKDVVTVTVASLSIQELAFSALAIIQVGNSLHTKTTTTLEDVHGVVTRGDTFSVDGTVYLEDDGQVDEMPVFVFMTKSREAEGVIVGKGHSNQGHFHIECTTSSFMEIGDYRVVSVSLGTMKYAPSSSDSTIRVRATTMMELGSEEEFLLDYGAIHGRLKWDNETGLMYAPISIEIASLSMSSKIWKFQNPTGKDGCFRIETDCFENAGVYEVKAMFSGNEYTLGSNAAHVVKLKSGLPTIQIFSENIAVRGEIFNINGTIRFKDEGVWGEPLTLTFDNQFLATIETRDDGSFAWSIFVDSKETLGSHIVTVALKRGNVSTVENVMVKSKTTLTTKISALAGGMFLLFSASLSDDQNMPIQGAEIVIDNYGLSWTTDKDGNLTFLLDPIKVWPQNLVLTIRFEGSDSHLPITTEKEINLEQATTLPLLIPLFSPTLIVIVFVHAQNHVRKRQAVQQISDMETVEERAMVEKQFTPRLQRTQPLKIVLPDIKAPFPNIWGIRDHLRIEIMRDKSSLEKIPEKNAKILIDEETVGSVELSQQGGARCSHIFMKKGEHKIQAILTRTSGRQPWNGEIKLRVVDYREETIRLYNEFLEKLDSHDIQAGTEMTASEIESLILRRGGFSPKALRKMTVFFEKAEYSSHLITRKDYETMYLSLMELNFDIG